MSELSPAEFEQLADAWMRGSSPPAEPEPRDPLVTAGLIGLVLGFVLGFAAAVALGWLQ